MYLVIEFPAHMYKIIEISINFSWKSNDIKIKSGLVFLWSIVSPKDIIPFDEYRKFRIHTVAFESQC